MCVHRRLEAPAAIPTAWQAARSRAAEDRMSSSDPPSRSVDALYERFRSGKMSRRQLLHGAQLAAGGIGLAAVLAACGSPGGRRSPTSAAPTQIGRAHG